MNRENFMFYCAKLFYSISTILFIGTLSSMPIEKIDFQIKKNNQELEEKITRQAIRFKKEMKLLKTVFFSICAVAIASNVYQLFEFIKSIFFNQHKMGSHSFFFEVIKGTVKLAYSGIMGYVIQKGIHYGVSYYCQSHPIYWILYRRVHIYDHFDSLLSKIAHEQKKSPLCCSVRIDIKNYILVFAKTIFKDIQQVCAFMKYRSTLLPSYKQPTVLLIQQNILLFVQEWMQTMQLRIEEETSSFDDLYKETLYFKKLLFEQIDLFVKIDDDKEFLRDIVIKSQLLMQ